MIRSTHPHSIRRVIAAASLALLSACASTPTTGSLVVGQQATVEGEVVRVDTAPWAYDGNAVVTVATAANGTLNVRLPARWNLCKAPPPENVQALQPHDRVQVVGTVTAPGELVVCELPEHHLHKIE